jgi:hypothetical protein
MWTTILWFLIFGAVFYWVMRMGGCGAHGAGGHGATHGGGHEGMHGGGPEGEHASVHTGEERWTVEDPSGGHEAWRTPSD